MKKRVGESILDDCPGVSQHRKKLVAEEIWVRETIAARQCGRNRGY
jgi:hypothetical protein